MMKFVELGICCEIINGSTPSRIIPEYWGGDINWFTPKDLSNLQGKFINESPEKINPKGYSSCSTSMLPANSLLYTSRAPIGHIAINKIECCTNQGFKSLIPKKGVDVNYLYYTLKQFTPQLQNLGNGATFKELSKATMSEFQIPLPPLETQQKIAAILDAADTLRQKDKALVAKYDELTQALFLDMFGDPVSNPKGWEKEELGKVLDVRDGTHDSPRYKENGYPLVTSKNIKNGKLILDDVNYISDADYNKINLRSKVDVGDIIMPMIGTIGNPLLVDFEVNFAIKNVALFKFKDNSIITNKMLLNLLNGHFLERFSSLNNKGGTQKFVSLGDIRKMIVPIPPINIQNQFAERVAIIEQQKAIAQASLEKSEELFNSLLQKAFKGELV
jgi:type I restriction enzyme S subunit